MVIYQGVNQEDGSLFEESMQGLATGNSRSMDAKRVMHTPNKNTSHCKSTCWKVQSVLDFVNYSKDEV